MAISLAMAHEQLKAGNVRLAQNMFFEIWCNRQGASWDERRQALHGYCAALDAQGKWHFAESEIKSGLGILEREQEEVRQEQLRREQADADVSVLMWGGAMVLGGVVFGSLFAPPKRRRRAA
jgi:hypothetical protein